jgi:TRAP-type mannitol/chloroaromatic compound transport system substrate-binding protein
MAGAAAIGTGTAAALLPAPALSQKQIGAAGALKGVPYPGVHEPGTGLTLGINRKVWESLDTSDQRIVQDDAAAAYSRSVAELNANNALWLRRLRDDGKVKILKFDNVVLKAFLDASRDVVAEAGQGDALSRKSFESYQSFRSQIVDWGDIAERAFLNARALS